MFGYCLFINWLNRINEGMELYFSRVTRRPICILRFDFHKITIWNNSIIWFFAFQNPFIFSKQAIVSTLGLGDCSGCVVSGIKFFYLF